MKPSPNFRTFISSFIVLILAGSLMGCDQLKKVDEALDKMDGLQDQVAKTNNKFDDLNETIHKQTLLVSMQEMLKESNFEKIAPLPTGIIPSAKAFAEVVTAEEMVELTYLWLREIDSTLPPSSANPPTPEDTFDFEKEKFSKLMILATIAAFLPDETVSDIIDNEILPSRRHQRAGLQVLALRYFFLGEGLLRNSVLAGTLEGIGAAEEAYAFLQKMQFIAALPFANLIKVQTLGINEAVVSHEQVPFININFTLDDGWLGLISEFQSLLVTNLKFLNWENQVFDLNPAKNAKIIADYEKRKATLLINLERDMGRTP